MEFVGDQKRADEVLSSLLTKKDKRALYFDLEADNFHHYNEILCTVQICAHGDFYLLDAINLDLSTLFCDVLREIPIWFHGCDYDLYLLRKVLDTVPEKLFDTQIAARLCGFTKFGYAPLVQQICGIQLPKDSQRADWTKRPLPAKMIAYAKNDVRYLPQISDILVDQLLKLKRLHWLEESCESLLTSQKDAQDAPPADKWRINGSKSLNPNALRFLKALYEWRDQQARLIDKPHFKVLNNDTLTKWVDLLADGKDITLPKSYSGKRKDTLMKVIEQAQSLTEDQWPEAFKRPFKRRVKIDEEAVNALIKTRDQAAKRLKIESSFIASRKVLESITQDPSQAENLLNWQRESLQL